MTRVSGSCHCGAVQLTAPRPDYVNDCNCTMCTKLGGLWFYCAEEEAVVTGETIAYVRADMPAPVLATHHCPVCGATTHWAFIGDGPHPRMGLNARLFDDDVREGAEIRQVDGRSWPL